ncbi:MAG: cysteine methyltransferase, partial [Planctomycetota bacterium]
MSMPQLPVAGDLAAELWTLLNQAPPGRVTTYGELAR